MFLPLLLGNAGSSKPGLCVACTGGSDDWRVRVVRIPTMELLGPASHSNAITYPNYWQSLQSFRIQRKVSFYFNETKITTRNDQPTSLRKRNKHFATRLLIFRVSYPQIWRQLSTDLTSVIHRSDGTESDNFFFWDTSPPRQHRLNGTVDARRCHWLATSAPFTAKESRVFRMASKQRWAPQSTCDAPKEIETESHLHKIQSNCWLPCIDFYSFTKKIVCV